MGGGDVFECAAGDSAKIRNFSPYITRAYFNFTFFADIASGRNDVMF